MTDDFHGTREWQVFLEGIKQVYPDREIVDLPKEDQIFHTLLLRQSTDEAGNKRIGRKIQFAKHRRAILDIDRSRQWR